MLNECLAQMVLNNLDNWSHAEALSCSVKDGKEKVLRRLVPFQVFYFETFRLQQFARNVAIVAFPRAMVGKPPGNSRCFSRAATFTLEHVSGEPPFHKFF